MGENVDALSTPGRQLAAVPSGVFWVSQSVSFRPEREGSFFFAPRQMRNGNAPVSHWTTMALLTTSSLVICSARKQIDFIAVPRAATYEDESPVGLHQWPQPGWRCDVDYHPLSEPIQIYEEISPELRISEQPRFMKSGKYVGILSQQYLNQLSPSFARRLLLEFEDRWPPVVRRMMYEVDAPDLHSSESVRSPKTPQSGSRNIGAANRPESSVQNRTGFSTIAQLVHEPLIHDYCGWLGRGLEEWTYPNGMRSDAFDPQTRTLIEAKPRLTSSELQRAVGQLMIYRALHQREHGASSIEHLKILTETHPGPEIAALLKELQIGLAHRSSGEFVDSQPDAAGR